MSSKSAGESLDLPPFASSSHASHCLRCLSGLPGSQAELDGSRLAIVFYCLGSLDLLGLLEKKLSEHDREANREWVWEQQTTGKYGTGFRPSTFMTPSSRTNTEHYTDYDTPHMITSYTALLTLSILRDDFSKLDRSGLLKFLRSCQRTDGSFSTTPGSHESDLRTLYCAFAICDMLGDWSAVDVDRSSTFIRSCRAYEGGYGQAPYCEAQGGTTYVAIAALYLAPRRNEPILSNEEREATIKWLAQKQLPVGGFCGRTGKEADACYCFWCSASLQILGAGNLVNSGAMADFIAKCQFKFGGIAKAPGENPDPYHTYLSIAALAMYPIGDEVANIHASTWYIRGLDPLLNATTETVEWARKYIGEQES